MSVYNRYLKRVFDLVVSLVLLLLFSWIMVMICVAYLLSFHLPVFYQQERIGKGQVFFMLYKFRSLSTQTHLPLQDRQFKLGALLRKLSLDELPQLFNVVKGEMSLVGPRPLPVEYNPLFSEWQHQRHRVRPGITGLAQVNGRNAIAWKEKLEYDITYVQQVSFLLDIKILWRTAILLFSFKDDVSLTEKKFTGKE